MWTLDKIIPILPVFRPGFLFCTTVSDGFDTGQLTDQKNNYEWNASYEKREKIYIMYLGTKETARKKVVNQEEAIFRLPTNKLKQLMRDLVLFS